MPVMTLPDLPTGWEAFLLARRGLSPTGTRIRLSRADEEEVERLAERYHISKAEVIRILVHHALRTKK